MSVSQKVIIVTTGANGTQGLTSVNKDLREGWRVVQIAPMGGSGSSEGSRFAAMVVLEQSEREATRRMEELEEQAEVDIEGQIEQALEGGYVVESEIENGGWKNPELE
jgi:hypothetical protein